MASAEEPFPERLSQATRFRSFYQHSLVRNASWLFLSNLLLAGLGFVFWLVAAREVSQSDVGIASVIITSASLVTTVGLLGLDSGTLRFFGGAESPRHFLGHALAWAGLATLVAGCGYLALAPVISPQVGAVSHGVLQAVAIVALVVSLSWLTLLQAALVSRRRAALVLAQNGTQSVGKIVLLVALASFGARGVVDAAACASICACIVGAVLLSRRLSIDLRPALSRGTLRHVRSYAGSLYAAGIQVSLVQAIIPILVLHRLGASHAADYYIAFSSAAVLNFIPLTSFQSLVAEGAHDRQSLALHVNRAARHVYALVLPAVVVGLIATPYLLRLFGSTYSNGATGLLRLLILATPIAALNFLADGVANVKQSNFLYLGINSINSAAIVLFSLFGVSWGLAGLGWAYLAAQVLTALIYAFLLRHEIGGYLRPRATV